jgi:hypothetical protein
LYFELLIPHSAESMSEKKRKDTGKTIAEKLEVIREVGKNHYRRSQFARRFLYAHRESTICSTSGNI